ncbi:DoxX family protein [Metabacillus litoralis]|uniref:DoxX family protein n=1 Tax=Metabacillus TaxID=2675233 RepID=UPI000EF5D67E|nr:DoxX family protein [Metabacillus litoralis]MCM3164051.1 DoxX family protein [Metabacillus litoralis]MCM3410541.1 DoxX family protein [Metabacillus litoralis]UHA58364.1 DoxX family protein [Metabacillus litoralis]
MNMLRGPKMAIIWTVLRIWLGIQWLEAGIHKVADGFDATGFIQGAIAKATGDHPAVQGWYATFLETFALPNVNVFNILIPWGEVLVGIGLILGAATIPALLAGAFMNLNFLLAGTVSTNPVLYTAAILLMVAGTAGYFYGADRFLIPYIRKMINNNRHTKKNHHEQNHLPAH